MSAEDIEQLPVVYRLALAYAPAAAKPASLALLALDTRLARIGAQASEPMIAQLKLAWWRDQFARAPAEWPKGEPLLGTLRDLGFHGADLAALVDGWEVVTVSENIGSGEAKALADGRASAWAALAKIAGEAPSGAEQKAAKAWSAGELAVEAEDHGKSGSIPRSLRALAVLAALGRRASMGRRPMLEGPAAMLLAMRVGIFGR